MILSTGLWLRSEKQRLRAESNQKLSELNLADSQAREALSLLAQHKELEAFVKVIQAGKILQKYRETDPDVVLALQETLNNRRGYNSLEKSTYTGYSPVEVNFSPDGKTLVSAGTHSIILWNVETGEKVNTLKGHESQVNSGSFSPNGKILA